MYLSRTGTPFEGTEAPFFRGARPQSLHASELRSTLVSGGTPRVLVVACERGMASVLGVEIVTPAQQCLLGFVAACERSGYNPTVDEVSLWLDDPEPRDAEYGYEPVPGSASLDTHEPVAGALSRMIEGIAADRAASAANYMRLAATGNKHPSIEHYLDLVQKYTAGAGGQQPRKRLRRVEVEPAEGDVEHLVRIGWLVRVSKDSRERVRLSDLGRALLTSAESNAGDEGGVGLVVLDRDDPLSYPRLVARLNDVGDGLLVDPYLEVAALHNIVISTQIERVMIGGGPRNRNRVGAISTYLGGALDRPIEVRTSEELHDRVAISTAGEVLTIGSSINGLNKHTTMIVPVPSVGAQALVSYYDDLWEKGVKLPVSAYDPSASTDGA